MGVWGMGLTQSDEFMDVYDQFVEEYNNGKEADTIASEVFVEYRKEFDADDGVLHDVYFAIAKAQWERGELQPDIFDRVRKIITSGDNVKFYEELDATASDLKKRTQILNDFLAKISAPPEKLKRRKKPSIPRPYPLSKGDVFVYQTFNGYGCGVVFEVLSYDCFQIGLIAISEAVHATQPTVDAVLDSYPFTLAWFEPRQVLPKKSMSMIGNVEIQKDFNRWAGVSISVSGVQIGNIGYLAAFSKGSEYLDRMAKYGIPRMRIKDYLL